MEKSKWLFLCTGNSCRSQMAEAWANHLGGEKVLACSAGTHPEGIRVETIIVMKEVGVDISYQTSDKVDKYLEDSFDKVITLCDDARDSCPVFTGIAPRSHHGFRDPAKLTIKSKSKEEYLSLYREIRDEIKIFVSELISQI